MATTSHGRSAHRVVRSRRLRVASTGGLLLLAVTMLTAGSPTTPPGPPAGEALPAWEVAAAAGDQDGLPSDTPTPTPTPSPIPTDTPDPSGSPPPVVDDAPEVPSDDPPVTPGPTPPAPTPSDPVPPTGVPTAPPSENPTENPPEPSASPTPSPPPAPPAAVPPTAPVVEPRPDAPAGAEPTDSPGSPGVLRSLGIPAPHSPVEVLTPSLDVARATAAVASAEAALTGTQADYDAARLDLAATMADETAARTRLREVRILADAAARRAEISTRTLAALVRSMVQHGTGTGPLDALLGDQDAADLLKRLGTVEQISALTDNLGEIRTRVAQDTQHAAELQDQLTTAEAAATGFPVAQKQETLAAAEDSLTRATLALTTATEEARAVLAGSAQESADRAREATSQLAGTLSARISADGWATPVVGTLTDGFGPRPDVPLPGVQPFHSGTDLAAECGSTVYAAHAGVVTQTGSGGTYGLWILIDHGGISTGYAHLADGSTLVAVGQTVIAGQVIAGVGSTGASTGCHLHVEVRIDGVAIDPVPFFSDRGIRLG